MNQIDIHYYTRTGGEKKVIPVIYDVEDRKDQCMQIMHCRVGLAQHEMPTWLYPEKFDLITHMREGMQIIEYSPHQDAELRTLDADFFRYKVYSEILFREQKRLADSYGQC
jgi:cobyrinic acid a,c-diamide synthase